MTEQDRTTRFLTRLDAHTATLPDDKTRRWFLGLVLDDWHEQYAEFVCTDGDSHPGAHATDLLLTICGISQRLSAVPRERNEPRL